ARAGTEPLRGHGPGPPGEPGRARALPGRLILTDPAMLGPPDRPLPGERRRGNRRSDRRTDRGAQPGWPRSEPTVPISSAPRTHSHAAPPTPRTTGPPGAPPPGGRPRQLRGAPE